MHALVRGRDYLCQGDEVVIVDPHTGRLSPGQQWTGGLHALVAIKEGLPLPPATGPAAQTSLQALFARYCRLGGASGTLREAALELAAVYGLAVMRVAPQRPSRHRALGWSFVANRAGLQRLVAERVAVQAALGRPVLVGTASVSNSESLARWLAEHGLEVQTLNARHGSDERQRLARAGEPGVVTVTTAIAGRGADIQPGAAALAAGGLHVVLTAFQHSARLDRQFAGRAARQGQPGSSEQILCADDGTLALWLPKALRRGLAALPALAARPLLAALQRALGLHDALQRGQLLDEERRIRRALAFTLGPSTPLS
jgi:preprotein translocase subunit SecA